MRTTRLQIKDLTVGQHVSIVVDTLWGPKAEWETVTSVRLYPRDNLVEVMLCNGPTLANIIRTYPEAMMCVEVEC